MIDPLDPGTLELKLPAQPMSNADRQRKLREERAKLGIKPLYVTPAEREMLGKALRLFERMNQPGDVPALLKKVAPLQSPSADEDDPFKGFWERRVNAVRLDDLQLFRLELTEDELGELTQAVCVYRNSWERYGKEKSWRCRVAENFWRRWVTLRYDYEYQDDDPKWSATAQAAETAWVRKELAERERIDPESLPFMLTRRDRSYLRSALDLYEYFETYGGRSGDDFERRNLLELYARLGPPMICDEKPEWPEKTQRVGYAHEQTRAALLDQKKAKCKTAEDRAARLANELARAQDEIKRLQASLQEIAAEIGVTGNGAGKGTA